MLFSLACLIGLTFAGQDGPTVPTASVRAADDWEVEPTSPLASADASPGEAPAPAAAPLDDEVEEFPDEPEGDDPEDPGEAMGPRGASQPSACVVTPGPLAALAPPPSPLTGPAPPAPAKGSTLSLLCRLRI